MRFSKKINNKRQGEMAIIQLKAYPLYIELHLHLELNTITLHYTTLHLILNITYLFCLVFPLDK